MCGLLATVATGILGCTIVVPSDQGARSVYVLGFARVRLPKNSHPADTSAYRLSGVGVAIGRLVQLGYFDEFQVELVPGSNAALILVGSSEELEHLEQVLKQLDQRGICIVSRN